MAYESTLDTYALGVAVASGLISAAMHATALAGAGKAWPPRRVFVANLISTAIVGVVVSQIVRYLPWRVDVVITLLAARLTGHVLGPRGVSWAFKGMVQAAQQAPVVGKFIPDAPPEEEPSLTKESKDDA